MFFPKSRSSRVSFSQDRRAFLKTAGLTSGALLLPTARAAGGANPLSAAALRSWANVLDHGAVNDGKTKNTAAINGLIGRLAAAGGGTLYFPPGVYHTGPIHFRSNISLHLEVGANVRFSDDFDDYLPMVRVWWQGVQMKSFSPLLYACGVENISIVGRGEFYGAGPRWWDAIRELWDLNKRDPHAPHNRYQEMFFQLNGQVFEEKIGFCRPGLLQFLECRNVLVQGVTFRDSPFWSTHFVMSEDIVVDGMRVYGQLDANNVDGINIEASNNARIANCYFHTNDDCVCIKAGKGDWALEHAKPSENVVVTNCTMAQGSGGISLGSEMAGGLRRISVSNCTIRGVSRGIHIKTIRGRGGVTEDVQISDLVLGPIRRKPGIGICVSMHYYVNTAARAVDVTTPRFRNLRISNVRGTELNQAGLVAGLEEMPIENLTLSNIDLAADTGMTCSEVHGLRLRDLTINAQQGPALACENVARLELDRCALGSAAAAGPRVVMKDVEQATLSRCEPSDASGTYLRLEGRQTRDIAVLDYTLKPTAIDAGAEVGRGAVIFPPRP